jgi:hypothetical protein
MEPIDRSPPGGGPIGRPPKHPKPALPGVWQKARSLCEKILSTDASGLNSFECASELKRNWEDLQKNGEIPSSMVKQFQTTLKKLKSVFKETFISEELQSLSDDVDLKRLQQIYERVLRLDKYIDPEELESLGKEVLKIWENAKEYEGGVTPFSKFLVMLATKAVSLYPANSFLALQAIHIDYIYEKLQKNPEFFSRIDHDLATTSLLQLYRSSDGDFSKELSEKIVFIANHLLLTSDNKDIQAIVERLTPKLLRGPDLVLSGAVGSDENFKHIHTFLLTSRPTSMREAGRLADEFISYFESHQYGVTIKQAAKMHTVAHLLHSIVDKPELERAVLKIRSCIAEYEEELADEVRKLEG